MPGPGRKLSGNDIYEAQRLATIIGQVSEGAGHSPVSLSASADTILTIGEMDEPQELTLDVQAANLGWFGPTTGAAAVPTFRQINTADLAAAGLMGIPALTFSTTNAEGTAASLLRRDATIALFSTQNPCTLTPDNAAAPGTSGCAARLDHVHHIAGGVPSLTLGTTNAEGTSASLLRTDATIGLFSTTAVCALAPDNTAAVGTSGCASRRDHVHGIPTAAPTVNLHQSSANAEGTSASFARSDHVHAILTSSSPGASASILATDANGRVAVLGLGVNVLPGANVLKSAVNVILDDGTGDSPQLQFVGGSNDDTIYFYLDDDAVAGNSDLRLRLCAGDGDSCFVVEDNGGNAVYYVNANGEVDAEGHVAIGGTAWAVSASITLAVNDQWTDTNGIEYGIVTQLEAEPTGNFTTSYTAMHAQARLDVARTQTSGVFIAVDGATQVNGTIAGTIFLGIGGNFYCDAEDGTLVTGIGARIWTPFVDTGALTTGYGAWIRQGTKGDGSMGTLYGLYIDDMAGGATNYAIYSAGGDSYFTDRVAIGGTVAAAGQAHIDQNSTTAAIPVLVLDQADISEGLINFIASDRGIIVAGNSVASVRVELDGTVYRLALYADA